MMKRIFYLILVCVLLCLTGCQTQSQETVFAMDTVMDLQVWGADSEKALAALKELIAQTEADWSNTSEDSLVSALNRGESVNNSRANKLLREVEALQARTEGAFDPKLHGAISLWGFDTKQYRVPDKAELHQGMSAQLWNLSAAVKGYTGRQAVACLKEMRVKCALLNLGGNVQTYGEKLDGTPWSIGIQNPAGGDPVGVVAVEGTAAVVTSGDYQRYFEEDGVRYHHILSPRNGKPAQTGLSSVTVICRDGLVADALSTALFVMGLKESVKFWQQSNDFEAVFITTEGQIYATEGAALSGCEFKVITREN